MCLAHILIYLLYHFKFYYILSDHCIVIYNIFLIVITMLQAKFYHCFVTDEIEAWESLVN